MDTEDLATAAAIGRLTAQISSLQAEVGGMATGGGGGGHAGAQWQHAQTVV
jgi:nanoRNase/pAp phosphatase (c-di-AMP/oligoRNAs hydrolase)